MARNVTLALVALALVFVGAAPGPSENLGQHCAPAASRRGLTCTGPVVMAP